jgi:hypothetical protein
VLSVPASAFAHVAFTVLTSMTGSTDNVEAQFLEINPLPPGVCPVISLALTLAEPNER